MALESLLQLVETLRERIDLQPPIISSEWQTRYALIDPLLRELGWDTADPTMVVPEDGSGNGRADYLLQADGKPCMVIEAKRLGASLRDAQRQALDYAMDASRQARYFTATNGKEWMIYDTHKPAVEILAISFDLTARSLAEASLNALALWRPRILEGAVSAGHQPIGGGEEPQRQGIVQSPLHPSSTVASPAAPSPATPTSQISATAIDAREWIPLTDTNLAQSVNPKPSEMLLPDNRRVRLNAWNSILIETTKWLINNNFLNESHCPVLIGETRYIVAADPTHSNGIPFKNARQVRSLYLEVNFTAQDLVKHTRRIIKHVGLDPANFKVRF